MKIIYSNSNGGHPYVKPVEAGKRSGKKKEDDSSLDAVEVQSSSNKSKVGRVPRVASPIATKTTPRRAAAVAAAAATAAAAAGRSSPFLNMSFFAPLANAVNQALKSADLNNSSLINNSDADNVIRRKLRSHTRQLQVGESVDVGKSTGPSPVTVQSDSSENTSNANNSNNNCESSEANKAENAGSEHSTESLDTNESTPSRKKRSRQQNNQQTQPTENTNETDLGSSSEPSLASSCDLIQTTPSASQQLNNTPQVQNIQSTSEPIPKINMSVNAQMQISLLSSSSCIKKYVDIKSEVSYSNMLKILKIKIYLMTAKWRAKNFYMNLICLVIKRMKKLNSMKVFLFLLIVST